MNRLRARGQLLRLTGAIREVWGVVINDQTMQIRGEQERILGRMQSHGSATLAAVHSRIDRESAAQR